MTSRLIFYAKRSRVSALTVIRVISRVHLIGFNLLFFPERYSHISLLQCERSPRIIMLPAIRDLFQVNTHKIKVIENNKKYLQIITLFELLEHQHP